MAWKRKNRDYDGQETQVILAQAVYYSLGYIAVGMILTILAWVLSEQFFSGTLTMADNWIFYAIAVGFDFGLAIASIILIKFVIDSFITVRYLTAGSDFQKASFNASFIFMIMVLVMLLVANSYLGVSLILI